MLVSAIAIWGYGQYQEKQQLEVHLGNRYQQSFYEMVENIDRLQVLLGKALVSTSTEKNILNLADIWKNSMTAQQELTRLPISAPVLLETAKFLSQTGDFAHVLAANNARGDQLSKDERGLLNRLRSQAAKLSEELYELENRVMGGEINWSNLIRGAAREIKEEERDILGDRFDDITEEMTRYPTLVYDGPFSDHITQTSPRGVTGTEVTREEARKKALEVIDISDKEDLEVVDSRSVAGRLPSYNFQVEDGAGRTYSIDISKKGGHLVNMIHNRDFSPPRLNLEEAAEKAKQYLARAGFPNMEPTYAEIKDNIAYISTAYTAKDIIFYPDIINIQLALDSGQVVAVEALSYLMSHRERELPEPRLEKKEVEDMLRTRFENIESIKNVVIPLASMKEKLCFEVKGDVGEETYLVYINAIDGNEEQILKLVKTEKGTFTL